MKTKCRKRNPILYLILWVLSLASCIPIFVKAEPVHGTAVPFTEPTTGEYGKLIWKQDFDTAQTIGDYFYDPEYISPYANAGATLGSSDYVYTGDGDNTHPKFSLVTDPITGNGKALSMTGETYYPIYRLDFGGKVLSKPGKYTFVFKSCKEIPESLKCTVRFYLNNAQNNVPEMGTAEPGTADYSTRAYSFTIRTKEEFDATGLPESHFSTSTAFSFNCVYLFLSNGNGKTVYFDDIEMWYEEYADITFHTDGPDDYVTNAASNSLSIPHQSFLSGSPLPNLNISGSDYRFIGWSREKNGATTVNAAEKGVYDLYAIYEKKAAGEDTPATVYQAIIDMARIHAQLSGRDSELPDNSDFAAYLVYAEKYSLLSGFTAENPYRPILRYELAALMDAALPENEKKAINTVADVPDIADYHSFRASVLSLLRAGIVRCGTDGKFHPYDTVLQDEYASCISRVLSETARLKFSMETENPKDTMIFEDQKRTSFDADFICAPTSYLATLEQFPTSTLALGKWISTHVTRAHIRRDCTINGTVTSAYAEFQSDNPFDLYINGKALTETQDENGWHLTGLVDVTDHIVSGTNRFAIRSYTSDDPLYTVSALRGAIHITYADGTTETISTDSSWKNGTVCGFWAGTEPENWQTNAIPSNYSSVFTNDLHPRQLRRSMYFRKAFDTDKAILQATLYACGRGAYVPYLNGERITDGRFLAGSMLGYTEYQVFDVTHLMANGENVLGAYTGNGHYNSSSWGTLRYKIPAVLMQLEIQYTDGSAETICTDTSWQVTASPLYDNDLQFGERYDARNEIEGWNLPGSTAGNWVSAERANLGTLKPFAAQTYAPVRIYNELTAHSIGTALDGEYVLYDFGVNSAGRAKITLKNTVPGETIIIRYCEIMDGDTPVVGAYGDVYFEKDNYVSGKSPYGGRNIDVYICKGAEEEVYLPEFTYTGFRYVYVKGYSGNYGYDTVRKIELNTGLTETGNITTSNTAISQIWDAVKRSYRSNIVTGPTDCPTREKNFWNGDISNFAATACWYMDNNAFLSRWTEAGEKLEYNVYGWEDEEYILPLTLYRYYGNKEILETKYPTIQKLIVKREAQLPAGQSLPTDHSPYNDHQAINNVSSDFFAAAFFCRMYKDSAEIATILGKTEDAEKYTAKFEAARAAFNRKYYLENGDYAPKNQSGIVLPVAFGIADEENIPKLIDTLHGYVASGNYHLTCGFSSMEFVLGILCDGGYENDAWKIITSETHPSLLYMIGSHGGGTTTESWRGYDAGPGGNSMNHYAIGGISRWFFNYLGGIRDNTNGFETFVIKPSFIPDMGDCEVTYESVHGLIASSWSYDASANRFVWNVTVPEGTTAVCGVPNGMAFITNTAETDREDKTLTAGNYTFTVGFADEVTFDIRDTAALGEYPYVRESYGKVIAYANGGNLSKFTYLDPSITSATIQISENGAYGALAKDPVKGKSNVTWVRSSGWEMYKPHFEGFTLQNGKYFMTAEYLIPTDSTVTDAVTFLGKPCFGNNKDYQRTADSYTAEYLNSNKNCWLPFFSAPITVSSSGVNYCNQSINSREFTKNYMAINVNSANSGIYVKNYAIYFYPAGSFLLKEDGKLTLIETSGTEYTFPQGSGEYTDGANIYKPGSTVSVSALEYKTIRHENTVTVTYVENGKSETASHYQGDKITKTAEKNGYKFLGWALSENGVDFVTEVPTHDVTLYAVFSRLTSNDPAVLDKTVYIKPGYGKVIVYADGSDLSMYTYVDPSVSASEIQISENGSYGTLAKDPAGSENIVTWVRSSGWEMYKPHFNKIELKNGKYYMSAEYLIPTDSTVTDSVTFLGKPCFDNGKDYTRSSGSYYTAAFLNSNKNRWLPYVSEPILVTSDAVTYAGKSIDSRVMTKNYMGINVSLETSGIYVRNYAIYYYPAGSFILDVDGNTALIETDGADYTLPAPTDIVPTARFAYWMDEAGTVYKPGDIVHAVDVEYKTLTAVLDAPITDPNANYREPSAGISGIRFRASVSQIKRSNASEYGFIVARKSTLDALQQEDPAAQLSFDLEENQYASGIAYKKENGIVIIDKIYSQDSTDNTTTFAATVIGIPENMENEEMVVRPYIRYDGLTAVFYGKEVISSLHSLKTE